METKLFHLKSIFYILDYKFVSTYQFDLKVLVQIKTSKKNARHTYRNA